MYFRGLLNCRMEAAQQVVCLAAARPRHAIGSHGVDCQSVKQMSFYENRARTTLRVEAQRCSGQAVRGLPPAAPVQELQPGTPVTTSLERPFWPFWPLTARWRLREQSTGKLPCKGFEHSEFKASRRCTRRGLPSAAPAAGGYSVPRRHSTAPRSDRPRTELRREGLRHPFAKTVKLFRRGHEAPRALMGATRPPRQVTSGDADADRDRPRGPVRSSSRALFGSSLLALGLLRLFAETGASLALAQPIEVLLAFCGISRRGGELFGRVCRWHRSDQTTSHARCADGTYAP